MHLYSGATLDFISDATQNRIAAKLEESFFQHFRHKVSQSEVRSWQNSLRSMATALQVGGLTHHGIVCEMQLPLTSKRLDCMITGRDAAQRKSATIVELKQWEAARADDAEGCVSTFVGGKWRTVLHPAKQVGQYARYLMDTHTAFNTAEVSLAACSYLHNWNHDDDGELFASRHEHLIAANPVFAGDRLDNLVDFLSSNVGGGAGEDVLQEVLAGKYRPSKRLLDHTAKIIRDAPEYVLLDEQEVAFQTVLAKVRSRSLAKTKSVVLINGGPGTGKSVIAVNLVGELSRQGTVVQHATGSKAFTENLRKVVGARAAAQFSYFNSFMSADQGGLDCLVLDESHRIRETSHNRFTSAAKRTNKAQVDELIDAAKVSVFFIDDMQIVRPGETGSSQLIRDAAARAGADVAEIDLAAQFRCNGSDAFIQWVDNTLDLRKTPHVLWDTGDAFEVDVVDSPKELEAIIRSDATAGLTARLVAGFCWNWSNPDDAGNLLSDVVIDDWQMPWNAKSEAKKLARGIPKSSFWATDAGGIDQVGCVYTAQGFEFDHVGVIWGNDLVFRPREGWVAQPGESRDRTVKSAAKQGDQFLNLVKQTYRVLLTRGMKKCTIYFQDEQTRDFVLSRIESKNGY